jgi:hypothetical protein
MVRKILPITVLLLVTAIFCLPLAPASLVQPWLIQQLPNHVQLADLQGSFANGRTEQLAVDIQAKTLQLGTLRWQLNWWSLLSFAPEVDVQLQGQEHELLGTLKLDPSGLMSFVNGGGHLPISILYDWFPNWLTGDIRVQINEISVRGQQLQRVSLMAAVFDTQWLLTEQPLAIGDYIAEAELRGEQLIVTAYDQQAAVAIDAELAIEVGSGRYQLQGYVQPASSLPVEMQEFIKALGKPSGQGIAIHQRGSLR